MDSEWIAAGHSPNPKEKKYRDAGNRILIPTKQFIGRSAQPPQTAWQFLQEMTHSFL